jgi:hypothetical protein
MSISFLHPAGDLVLGSIRLQWHNPELFQTDRLHHKFLQVLDWAGENRGHSLSKKFR